MKAIVNILGPECGDLAVMVIHVFGGLDETLKHGELFVQQGGCGGQEPQGRVESRETNHMGYRLITAMAGLDCVCQQ